MFECICTPRRRDVFYEAIRDERLQIFENRVDAWQARPRNKNFRRVHSYRNVRCRCRHHDTSSRIWTLHHANGIVGVFFGNYLGYHIVPKCMHKKRIQSDIQLLGNSVVVEALEKVTAVHSFLAGVLFMATRSMAF